MAQSQSFEDSKNNRLDVPATRSSGRLREQNSNTKKDTEDVTFQSEGGRVFPMRDARNRSTLSHEEYFTSHSNIKQPTISNPTKSKPVTKKRPIVMPEKKDSGAPRLPRVIVIGAGISGLACARELSERRHDVLVLEARNRLGGRLRTVDLMMEEVDEHQNDCDQKTGRESTDLLKVRQWSPVDVGGAFIHGTGQYTTRTDENTGDSGNIGSHDFGTNKSKTKRNTDQPKADTNLRKSSRLSINYDVQSTKATKEAAPTNNRNLNPVFVLASRKLRLPVQAAEGAFTCLVDHEGDLISEEVDEEVSHEFNEVLDLATKCCENGMVPILSEHEASAEPLAKTNKKPSPKKSKKLSTNKASPNYVSDDTAHDSEHHVETKWMKINPDTTFGAVFETCRKYHQAMNKPTKTYSPKEMNVRNYLFQWHVANLEMSSGAPMHELGQRWNDDGE